MSRRVASASGLILLLMAVPWTLAGIFLVFGGIVFGVFNPCHPTAPVCRGVPAGVAVIGVAVVAVGVLHALAGIGALRQSRRAYVVGIVLSVAGIAITASEALTAFEPVGSTRQDPIGMVPIYDTGAMLIAAALVPYSVALVGLLLAAARSRAEAVPAQE